MALLFPPAWPRIRQQRHGTSPRRWAPARGGRLAAMLADRYIILSSPTACQLRGCSGSVPSSAAVTLAGAGANLRWRFAPAADNPGVVGLSLAADRGDVTMHLAAHLRAAGASVTAGAVPVERQPTPLTLLIQSKPWRCLSVGFFSPARPDPRAIRFCARARSRCSQLPAAGHRYRRCS